MPGRFFDTNVLLYVASGDTAKVERAERLIADGGTISVQVLNEIANVARRNGSVLGGYPFAFVNDP
jgi:predicted nucleic acid-binding protein